MATNKNGTVTGVRLIGVYAGYRVYRPRNGKAERCMMMVVAGSLSARLFYDMDMCDVLDEHAAGELCSVVAEPFVSSNGRLAWGDAQEPSWEP